MANPLPASASAPHVDSAASAPSEPEPTVPQPDGKYGWHDTGNADRLADSHGTNLIYCTERKGYYVFTGKHWEYDELLKVEGLSEETICRAYKEAGQITDEEKRKDFLRHVSKSLSRNSLGNMVHLAKKKVRALSPTAFDADPWALNCRNVTVDLRTGQERPHRREDLNSKIIPLAYNAGAECPLFLRSLYRIMGDGPDASQDERDRAVRMVEYLQKLFGCAATGKPEKLLVIFYGKSGNNGKTTLLETINRVLGDDVYACVVKVESLMLDPRGGTSNATTSDLSDLLGVRFAHTGEVDRGQRLSLSRVKDLTGLGSMKTRRLRENWVTFKPTHKLFVDANERPEISSPADPIWNRVKCVPFEVELSRAEIDPDLPAKLEMEFPGILTWIVAGARRYHAEGLRDCPAEVLAATAAYQADSDRLKTFIEDSCDLNRYAWVSSESLVKAYTEWCAANGEKNPLTGKDFTDRLRDRGCAPAMKEIKAKKTRGWDGIYLKVNDLRE